MLVCCLGSRRPQLNFFGNWGKPAASDSSDGGCERGTRRAGAAAACVGCSGLTPCRHTHPAFASASDCPPPSHPCTARRRLAEAAAGAAASAAGGAGDQAPILAFTLGDNGPIIIPEEVDPQNPELVAEALGAAGASHASGAGAAAVAPTGNEAAPAPAPGAAPGPQQVGVLGASDDCASVRWRVERAVYNKQAPLQPADLWSAQVARRRASN